MDNQTLITNYFKSANNGNIDEMLEYFAHDAVVMDEGKEHHGKDNIRQWIAGTIENYRPQYELLNSIKNDDEIKAITRVSGTFPNSPLELGSSFMIINERITLLKCGL